MDSNIGPVNPLYRFERFDFLLMKESTGTPSKRTKLDPGSTSDVKIMFTGLAQEDQARKVSLTILILD